MYRPDRRSLLATASSTFLASALGAEGATGLPKEDHPKYWDAVRNEFDLAKGSVFLNTATLGCPPRVALEAMAAKSRELARTLAEWDYVPGRPAWIAGYEPETRLREKLAGLVGADVTEVSLTQNATMGMSSIAAGLDLSAGDEVVLTDQEHPGGRSGWDVRAKRHGLVIRTVELPKPPDDPSEIVARVAALLTARTKVLAVPHVTSALGTILPVKDLATLARGKGIFTVVDGAQAIGQLPLDLHDLGCDAYFASPHKWLYAPAGNGLLYVRKESAGRIWTTLASSEWANTTDPGFRLQQRGTGNVPLLVGLEAALDFYLRIGPTRVQARILELGDRLRTGLQAIPRVRLSTSAVKGRAWGMTTFLLDGVSPKALQAWLWERARVRPRDVSESWGTRVSTAVYNSPAEVDRLLTLLAERARMN